MGSASQTTVPRHAFGVREVAASLGIAESTCWEHVRSGRIASFRLGGRVLVSAAELHRLVSERSPS